jgi:hypothetical protein
MLRRLLMVSFLILAGCMPQSGPSPKAMFVISSSEYDLARVLEALDAVPDLGRRVDKKPEFDYYESAYWYSDKGSQIYGVGLVKWPEDLEGDGTSEMKDRYFVDVYATDGACALCKSVKASLTAHHISFFSACENPKKSTAFERIRCGT